MRVGPLQFAANWTPLPVSSVARSKRNRRGGLFLLLPLILFWVLDTVLALNMGCRSEAANTLDKMERKIESLQSKLKDAEDRAQRAVPLPFLFPAVRFFAEAVFLTGVSRVMQDDRAVLLDNQLKSHRLSESKDRSCLFCFSRNCGVRLASRGAFGLLSKVQEKHERLEHLLEMERNRAESAIKRATEAASELEQVRGTANAGTANGSLYLQLLFQHRQRGES